MNEQLVIELLKTLSQIKENTQTSKEILDEARRASDYYSKILAQLKIQNTLLSKLEKSKVSAVITR